VLRGLAKASVDLRGNREIPVEMGSTDNRGIREGQENRAYASSATKASADCNPLPGGSTTTSFVCPDGGMLAWREKSSNVWTNAGVDGATCGAGTKTWSVDWKEGRYYACLSDDNVCEFT
ncbi:hypothetical protein PENTCL1PPCAC_30874, partial [Pristionchus entomophagus]